MAKEVVVALTGGSGNMGRESVRQLLELEQVKELRLLFLPEKREKKLKKKGEKQYGNRVTIMFGNEKNIEDVRELIKGADYVFGLAAVIPPLSDKNPQLAKEADVDGPIALTNAIQEIPEDKQPKYVHISTVAAYGNRDYKHPWGRVGDPLIPSVFDAYAMYKVIGERYVLESEVKTWAVLRQTGMLHSRMLMDNISDGLMFHTCPNVPIEWSTANDSGRLIKRIVEYDTEGKIDGFWKKMYNIGGLEKQRVTGFDTFNDGFKIIGGSSEKFMKPHWSATRNFHCMWFYDSRDLDNIFHYVQDSFSGYWDDILKAHPIYAAGKIVPPKLLSKIVIQRLLTDHNAPMYWINSGNVPKVQAYFGGMDKAKALPTDWKDYPLFCRNQIADQKYTYEEYLDESKVKERGMLLSHGYDESKKDEDLDLEDMKQAAKFRGGEVVSKTMEKGDLYTKLEWKCHKGHTFKSSPFTVIKAGHWCPECCEKIDTWNFDEVAKHSEFFAQIWYDTHDKDENYLYYFDKDYKEIMEKLPEEDK